MIKHDGKKFYIRWHGDESVYEITTEKPSYDAGDPIELDDDEKRVIDQVFAEYQVVQDVLRALENSGSYGEALTEPEKEPFLERFKNLVKERSRR